MRDTASIILAGGGGIIQITGFALVWISAARERKRDYDEVGLVRRFWRWLKYQFSAPQPPAHPGYSTSDFSATSDSATVQGGTSQLDLLRREIGELRLHVHEFERSAEQRFVRVDVVISALSDRLARLRSRRVREPTQGSSSRDDWHPTIHVRHRPEHTRHRCVITGLRLVSDHHLPGADADELIRAMPSDHAREGVTAGRPLSP
jgi:hypothetical protein